MKKFTKILGFLGFFVTLAIAQIGTAFGIQCAPGTYLPRGANECESCPGTANIYGSTQGVYCLGTGDVVWEINNDSDQGLSPCSDEKACSTEKKWLLTPEGARSADDCMDTCTGNCIFPNSDCPLENDGSCQYKKEDKNGHISCKDTACTVEAISENYCEVTCPTSCEGPCTCPDDNCAGYQVENIAGVVYCDNMSYCDVRYTINNNEIVESQNYQCKALDVCEVKCTATGNPSCPDGTTCEWDSNSPAPVMGYLNEQNQCVDSNGNVILPATCGIIVTGCSDPCKYWDGKECVPYTTAVTYKCGNSTQVGPTATCGVDYFVNRQANQTDYVIDLSNCTPAGQVFDYWKLNIDNSQHSNDDRFTWNYTNATATFEAEWEEDKLYIHYHRYDGNWVQSNPPADDKEAFTISELPLTKTWTLTRNNSTFLGWCDDDLYYNYLSDETWLNSHCQGAPSYTIPNTVNSDVYLYAWWGCVDGYTLNNSYQCVANAIDVIYTCTSPDSGYSTINKSFSGDATVGATYTIRSVGSNESNQQVDCSFPGYYLENNYQWKRVGSNPEELYSPGPMNSPWAYTTTQTFELSGDYWKPNTYRVLYKCGSIDGNPVSGGDTADGATYGQPYYVATNIYDSFINNCSEPNGYVVDYWTFEQNNMPRYNTGEQFNNPNGWNLAADDHYFVAHWVQTGGTLTLDPNGGSASTPATLYTTQGTGVYLDPTREQQMSTNSNGLTTNPSKSASVQIYPNGTGANFQWSGSTITYPAYVDDDITLDFTGFYNDDDTGDVKLCIGTDKFITSDGISIGSGYNVSESHTWYAHWDPRQIYLPIAERSGYDFFGWYDASENGNLISNGNEYYEVSGDIVLYAHWGVACRSVSFDENGGTSTGGGNNNKFWKISGETGWYGDSACTSGITPNVGSSRPTKENATFIGYDDTDSTPTVRIFNDLGAITTAGENWTITQNATLYAQYECNFPYHLDTDPESDTYGQCVTCAAGEFYQDDQCKTCNQILEPLTDINGWTSRAPYNWSIKQCYRVCDGTGDTQTTCDVVNPVSGHSEMEQFLTGTLINGNTGKQISFYGNEFATSGAFNTCNAATSVTNCPQGLLADPTAAHKLMAAAVDFYEDRDQDGTYESNGKRYIIGGRSSIENGVYKLNNGFVWSQVVGDAQVNGDPGIISIIYPATSAPVAPAPEHHTFSNYGYPAVDPAIMPIDSTLELTTGASGNAAGIISYAINLDPANNNMSPIINQNRNLYAQYTPNTYNYEYNCNCTGNDCGGNPPTGGTISWGQNFNPDTTGGTCTNGECTFTGWQDSNGISVTPEPWNYDTNQTFYAVWDCPTTPDTMNIYYNKIPVDDVNANGTTDSGNTYVHASSGTPTTFTCGDGTTPITGHPQLKNSNEEIIGEVVEWCDDNELSQNCATTRILQNNVCQNKNVYAKWECTDSRYHLNENKDDCVVCPNGDYWDPNANNGAGACVHCSNLPGGGWTSIAGYNWGADQCYRVCNGDNGTSDVECRSANLSYGSFNVADIVENNRNQIEFYGNWRNRTTYPELDVCGVNTAGVTYCPKLLNGSATEAFKPMSSPVTFMKKDNGAVAGTRHIIGNRAPTFSNPYYLTNSSGKIWSHIMGPGQQTGAPQNYTFIIYPTDIAPAPSDTANDPLFKGYYDAQSGGNPRVAETLVLNSTNAVAFAQSPLNENQIGNRTLYPQYCAEGYIWQNGECAPQTWTVKYDCGTNGMPDTSNYAMQNTATYNESYVVAKNNGSVIAVCNPSTGYVLKLGGPNNNNPMWKLNNQAQNEHYTGEYLSNGWTYNISNPTFTAQYECDTEHGYTLQNGQCVLGSGLCQAQLPTNPDPHATMGTPEWNATAGCVYTITCDPCIGTSNHSCYTYNGMNPDNGQFTITGAVGDAGAHVLDNVFCSPSTYTVYYRCNDNASPTTDTTSAVYGEDYTIRTNGYSTGDILNCTSGTGQFNGWTFNGGSNPDQLYEGGAPLLWTYYNLSPYPLFTAHYGQCDEGQVLINGFCETCTCPQSNWTPTGAVQSCDARPLTDDSCQAAVTCNEPYGNPQWSCDGAVCSASCSTCPDNQVSVGGVCYDTCTASCDAPSTDNGCPVSGYPTFVTCSYDVQSVGGYDTGDGRCRYIDGANAGQVIDLGACSMTGVTCNDTNYDWNGDSHACERTANYTCGNHGSSTYPMSNIVQYGQNYVVAYKDGTQIAGCTQIDTGYTFIDKWTLNTAPLNTGGFGTGNTIWWGSGGQTYFTNSQSPLFTAMYSCATGYYEPVPDTCCDIATTYWNSSTQQCETCPNGYHPNSNNTDCDPDGPTPDQYHRIALDRNGGTLSGENSAPVNLYTIEDDNVYSDPQRNNPFTELTSNPTKYSPVTFNYCNQNSTTNCSGSQTDSRDAYFEFKGFYDSYNEKTIDESNPGGRLNSYGFTQAIGYTGTADPIATWYAHWSDHSSIAQDQWFTLSDDVRPGYSFLRWTSQPNCADNTVSYTQNNSFTGNPSNDVVYACWERTSCPDDEILIGTDCKKKCWVGCTWTGAPTNPTACPSNIANIPDVVNCTYDSTSPVPKGPGYLQFPESTQCLDVATNQLITPYSPCDYTVNCTPPKVWNPSTSSCVYPSGTLWNVKFVCDTNGSLVQEYDVSVNGTINVPGNSTDVCANTGYSFTNWKDTAHPSASLVAGANNVPWTHEYNATYIPDWNDGNVYHAHLNPYSYGQSNQSGTFGDAGVENLWERYGDNWYKNYNNGNLAGPMSFLNAEQLPTRTGGYSFAGYKTMDGYPRLNYADGRWNLMSPATITDNEEWYAQWTQCTPGQYYLNGCQNCPPSHPNSDPATATSMYDCYYSCSRCETNGCPTFGGAVCTYTNPDNLNNGGVYYGTNTCVLLPGNTTPNCPYTVTSCAQGYQVNSNQTACEPIQTVVNYSCGTNGSPASYGVQMFNTATYGENYTVAQNDQNQEIQCTPTTTGYVLLLDTTHGNKPVWNLNYGTGQSDYTGHTFTWQYIFPSGTTPTFTAQYVCDTDNGYHLINGTCQKCPENSYWTGSQCKECDQGYHVNDAGDGCTPNTVNLNYITQCGTSNPQSSTCTFNTGFDLATHNTNTGYTFNGWTTNGNTYTGPFNLEQQIQCTAAYLGNAVYANDATIDITGICPQVASDAIYECGEGATGNPPTTETMNYGATHTVRPQANCGKSSHTFNGWHFTGTNGYYNAGAMIKWNYETNQTFTGQWCENCVRPSHGGCELGNDFAGSCQYTCSCEPGYKLVGDCNAHPVCEPDSSLKIIYRPNGGVNPQTSNNQPVRQSVTYGDEFTTLFGTTFTLTNHILTRWDLDGDDTSTFDKHQDPDTNQYYAGLKEYYEHYNTLGDTILDAHWEQCTCDADNCITYATDENKCACSATCPTGYTYGGCNCDGTVCAPNCTQCTENEVSINNECVECECTPGTGAATCGALLTTGNVCEWEPSCQDRFIKVNPNCTGIGNTTCNPTCTECLAGWISNADHTECQECPANTYQLGNTCEPCQNGYTSPAGSSSADACVPGAHTIHYLSNNGANETYNQPVTYGQSFVTEGGTRFTKNNHIMTRWNVESGPSNTFTNGAATLSGNYVYNDATDTTLSAQWAQCTCDADGCTTYATNSNECACNASEESCPDGYIYGGCECNGTNCAPICTLSQSNAIYNCGTGTGIPPVSELVSYGTPYTIKANATVYGCSRENSTFAGWEFDGDQQIHAAGDTVTWNYTTDKNFRAVYCNNCLPEDHCTLDIPNPGECVVTCHTGYEWDANLKKCVAKTYENGITYKPNGGTPNRNYTQTVTYDASFTTLDWSAEHYRKPRNILTRWTVESGGAGTFDSGYANLGTEYTYKTDGATVLAADWTECAADKISLNNQCQQCNCTAGTGTTSCGTLSTDDDTCAWGPVSCLTGYVNPTLDCSDDTTNCTAYCTKCGNKQVEVNGACTDCECEINGDGVNSGCGFVSNNGNICNWNPTTCELGYGYPDLTCTETDHNNNCTASCTICEAGYYGDDGVECKPCPDGYTSLPGATSKKECFIDPNSCEPDEHIEHGECVSNTRACSIPNATSAARIWNPAIGTYGPCTVIECDAANGYHESGNACVRDTCTVAHGSAESERVGPTSWECFVTRCDPGYEPSSDAKSCVECANRYVDGDVAVSSYVSECEIAACMYQGQKYALQNGECAPICEDETDETGTKVWDDTAKKCVRTCKPGYKMW